MLIFKMERYGIKDKFLIETGKIFFFAEPRKVLKQELLQRARQEFWLIRLPVAVGSLKLFCISFASLM